MVGAGGGKKRRDQNSTTPGRRTRKQIGVEKRPDEERAGRLRRIPGQLEKLDPHKVADMLVEEALEGEMTQMLLLLRLGGFLRGTDDDGKG